MPLLQAKGLLRGQVSAQEAAPRIDRQDQREGSRDHTSSRPIKSKNTAPAAFVAFYLIQVGPYEPLDRGPQISENASGCPHQTGEHASEGGPTR